MPEYLISKQFEVISPVFRNGADIPVQYSCRGQNVNPPLNLLHVPDGTQSLTLIMHDPDALGGDYLHWLVFDIPSVTETIPVNSVPVGAVQGKNGAGESKYSGPCPPKNTGTHRYIFDFFALDTTLDLSPGASLDEVLSAQKKHVIDHYSLVGMFAAKS